jgi:hypothetical protein
VRPFFLPARTLAAASPFWLLLWAWGATQRRTPLPYLVALAAVTMAAGSLLYLAGEPVKPPYREAMALVAGAVEPGRRGAAYQRWLLPAGITLRDAAAHGLLLGDPDPRKPREVYEAFGGVLWSREEALAAGERLWLVVALEHSLDWQLEQVGWFDSRLERLREEEVGGIQIYLIRQAVAPQLVQRFSKSLLLRQKSFASAAARAYPPPSPQRYRLPHHRRRPFQDHVVEGAQQGGDFAAFRPADGARVVLAHVRNDAGG